MKDYGGLDTLLLNVGVIPPDDVATAAIELSRRACSLGGSFQLDNVSRFAHLTLYMARFDRSQLGPVHATLRTSNASLRGNVIEQTGYFLTRDGYYELSYARTPALLSLHKIVSKLVAGFRFRPGNPVREGFFGKYTDEQAANAMEWGYDLMGPMYRPHVTLTHYPEQPESSNLPTTKGDLSFRATEVGLFEADDMGSARRLIGRISLAD